MINIYKCSKLIFGTFLTNITKSVEFWNKQSKLTFTVKLNHLDLIPDEQALGAKYIHCLFERYKRLKRKNKLNERKEKILRPYGFQGYRWEEQRLPRFKEVTVEWN